MAGTHHHCKGEKSKALLGVLLFHWRDKGQHCLVATVSIRTASMSLVCVSAAKLHSLPSSVFDLLCDLDTSWPMAQKLTDKQYTEL